MYFNANEIEALTLNEIAGLLTAEDREFLYQAIARDKEAYRLWSQLHQSFNKELVASLREHIPPAETIIKASNRRQRKIFFFNAVSMTAAVLFMIYILSFFWPAAIPARKELAHTNAHHIQLQLASGKNIDLSAHQSEIKLEGMTFTNMNDTLSYRCETNTTPVDEPDPAPSANTNRLTVPPHMDYTLELADGTEVHLNANSTLIFPFEFTGPTREITIYGEAYLKVAANARQPFVVHLPKGNDVRVLGTEFNVNTYDSSKIKISLLSGAVSVVSGDTATQLRPGLELTCTPGAPLQISPLDQEEALSWHLGRYSFDAHTLPELQEKINRWYKVAIVIDSDSLRYKRFSGTLNRTESLETFIKKLRTPNGSLQYYFDSQGNLHVK